MRLCWVQSNCMVVVVTYYEKMHPQKLITSNTVWLFWWVLWICFGATRWRKVDVPLTNLCPRYKEEDLSLIHI